MRAVAVVAAALLACVALVKATEIQEFKYPKTVVVVVDYDITTLTSDEITVANISAAPWSKRSWNKTPRPAALTSFSVVVAYKVGYKPAAPVAACTIVANGTAFTCTFNATIVAKPLPLTVQYVAATSDNNTAIGYAIIKPAFVKPGFEPKPVFNGTFPHPWENKFNGSFPHPWENKFNGSFPHPWENKFNGSYPHPWENKFNGTFPHPWENKFNGTFPHPWENKFNGTFPHPWENKFNGTFPWEKKFNRTFHRRRFNKTSP